MRKLTKKYKVHLAGWLLLLALLPVSCIKDDYAPKDKATVTVTFTTRALSNPTTDAGGLEANEQMRTLRVIVARQNGEILYNLKYDIAEDETSKTITFSELTVNKDGEDFDFYAIANEDGTGFDDWGSVLVRTLNSRILGNIGILNKEQTVIPQTAKATIKVTPQESGIQTTIPLQFAVAKVRLTINNTSTAEQTVSDINLFGVNTTSTKLFGGTPVTSADTGEALSLGTMTDIPAETNGTPGKSTVYAYFYENTNNDYILTATWEGSSKKFDIKTLGNLSEIKRGTELDITITIKKNVTTPEDFFIQVNSWDSADMEIPEFQ